jgi:hypothetical protein
MHLVGGERRVDSSGLRPAVGVVGHAGKVGRRRERTRGVACAAAGTRTARGAVS